MMVRNVECGVRNGRAGVDSAFRTPHSALAVEHRRLFGAPWRRKSEMPVRGPRGAPATRRAGEKPLLHQERLVHLLEGARVLTHRRGDARESPRPALDTI